MIQHKRKTDKFGRESYDKCKKRLTNKILQGDIIENPQYIDQGSKKDCDLYTCIKRVGKKFEIYQEVLGIPIPNSQGSYTEDKLPWMALRFVAIDGEDYGRGFVEEYIGDLKTLEGLTRAIVEGSAASSKLVFLVRPNGSTKLKTLADAPNGAFVHGDSNDVQALQVQKAADLAVAERTAQTVEARLSFAFLLNSSVQRNAERVTAEEVRFMAQELETAIGGIYSVLSQEFQLPLVKILLARMEKAKKMPKFPKDTLKPQIVTGLEALGRGQDLNKLAAFLQYLQPLGAQVVAQELNINDYIDRLGASLGIDTGGLVKSEEQKQAEMMQAQAAMQQQQMAAMAEKGVAPAVKGFVDSQNQQPSEEE